MTPLLLPVILFTPRVMDCVSCMDQGRGYTVIWQEMTPQEKFCVERVCKKDRIKRMRVAMLRIADAGQSRLIEIPKAYEVGKENIEE